ncbi:MAG: ATP:cob(I)alamin adenosyltransferase, partial [Pseudomonadota bacterium]
MVRLDKIYTRGGDSGQTSLGGGQRVAKFDLRVTAYGTVDEANAAIGCARLHVEDGGPADEVLARLQNDLFDLGADLCTKIPEGGEEPGTALRIVQAQVDRLEGEIDQFNDVLPPLKSFVLPGGS